MHFTLRVRSTRNVSFQLPKIQWSESYFDDRCDHIPVKQRLPTAQVQRECHELAAARLPKNRGMHGFIKCYEEALQQNFVVDQLVLGFFHERCKKQEAHKILEGTPEI